MSIKWSKMRGKRKRNNLYLYLESTGWSYNSTNLPRSLSHSLWRSNPPKSRLLLQTLLSKWLGSSQIRTLVRKEVYSSKMNHFLVKHSPDLDSLSARARTWSWQETAKGTTEISQGTFNSIRSKVYQWSFVSLVMSKSDRSGPMSSSTKLLA